MKSGDDDRLYRGVVTVQEFSSLVRIWRGYDEIYTLAPGESTTCELAIGDVFSGLYGIGSFGSGVTIVNASGISFENYISGSFIGSSIVTSIEDGFSVEVRGNVSEGSND